MFEKLFGQPEELRKRLLALGYESAAPPSDAEPDEADAADLRLAGRRAITFAVQFCNRIDWEKLAQEELTAETEVELPRTLREALLDLAAGYFLQAKMALTPESLTVMPTLTSLRLGDAAWSFGGGTQKSGVDSLSRAELLAAGLLREAKAALCAWRSL